jgi:ABC-type phosphate transport system permease subunit
MQGFVNVLISIFTMLVFRSPVAMGIFGFIGGIYFSKYKPESANEFINTISSFLGSVNLSSINSGNLGGIL